MAMIIQHCRHAKALSAMYRVKNTRPFTAVKLDLDPPGSPSRTMIEAEMALQHYTKAEENSSHVQGTGTYY